MKVTISDLCMGDRNCNKLCPEVFAYDEDELLSIVKLDEIPDQFKELVRQATFECGAKAIEIEEQSVSIAMGRFRESETAKNLLISFSAECQARTRYNFFARRAEDDGFIQVSKLFDETANQEYEHALRFFKFFNGGELEISWHFPSGVIEDTLANLLSSAELERYVHEEMYHEFAQTAETENFKRAADTFNSISVSEKYHEQIFRDLAYNINNERVFSRPHTQIWKCIGCGYLHHGTDAPDKCPACVRPRGYFELLGKNW